MNSGLHIDTVFDSPVNFEVSLIGKKIPILSTRPIDAFKEALKQVDSIGLIFSIRQLPDGEETYYNSEEILRKLGVWGNA